MHEGATDGGNLPPASTPLLKPDGTTPAQSAPTVPPPAGATVTLLLQKVSSPPSALGTAVLADFDPTTPSNAGNTTRRIDPRKHPPHPHVDHPTPAQHRKPPPHRIQSCQTAALFYAGIFHKASGTLPSPEPAVNTPIRALSTTPSAEPNQATLMTIIEIPLNT